MYSSLDDVGYLSRSPSRIRVLEAIHETPHSQRDLRELTDVSRVTLSRILANFEGRGWIEQTNGQYETTSEGRYVARELTRLLTNMEMVESLDGVMDWLPVEQFDFDLTCLRDATVTTSSWEDHTAQIRAATNSIPGSERITATASGVSRPVAEAMWKTAVDGGSSVEVILDAAGMEIVLSDAELRQQFREMLEAGSTEFLRYEGDDEPLLMVTLCDDTVVLCGHDEDGPPPGTLETRDRAVRSWAESYFDSVRVDSSRIEPDFFVN